MTRIYHRFDSKENWNTQKALGYGKLQRGELGVAFYDELDFTIYEGYLGVSGTPASYDACPLMFRAVVSNASQATPDVFEPVVVKFDGSIPTGSTVVYDATTGVWEATNEILRLDSYPQANGTVAWDQAQGEFVVGAAVSAVGIDGGSYP